MPAPFQIYDELFTYLAGQIPPMYSNALEESNEPNNI